MSKKNVRVEVKWFDTLKGFGEGVGENGETIFLPWKAIKSPGQFATLSPGQIIYCTYQENESGSFKATSIILEEPLIAPDGELLGIFNDYGVMLDVLDAIATEENYIQYQMPYIGKKGEYAQAK
jgi:cold shock CspA family protein